MNVMLAFIVECKNAKLERPSLSSGPGVNTVVAQW